MCAVLCTALISGLQVDLEQGDAPSVASTTHGRCAAEGPGSAGAAVVTLPGYHA